MNEQNFDYLKNQLKYTGFGEDLLRELREKMAGGEPEFMLMHYTMFGQDHTEAALQFRKSDNSELYFFNKYLLQLKKENGQKPFTQSFRVGKENNITLKEAYNLMSGRSIHKEVTPREGGKFHAWLQLNFKDTDNNGEFKFKQLHENYGYNLLATLLKYPIKEMNNPDDAQRLIRSLERGNRQSITLQIEGKEEKLFVEASPQYKSLNFYDSESRRIIGESQSRLQKQPVEQHRDQEDAQHEQQVTNKKGKKINSQ